MIIRKEHAVLLKKLLKEQNENKPYTELSEKDTPVMLELERAELVRQQTPVRWVLTYTGTEVAKILEELYRQGPVPYSENENDTSSNTIILKSVGLDEPEKWDDDFRWIGSEIIAMLDAANRAGHVGSETEDALISRGLALRIYDRDKKREQVILSEAGQGILEIYQNARPRLIIDSELAEFIRKSPMGPAQSSMLPLGSHEEHLLEAMRLIAYSIPNSDIVAFTALGQAVKHALETGGFGEGTVFSEEIMWNVAHLADGEDLSEEALAELQSLAYADSEGNILPAGEWALEAFRIWHDGPRKEVWTIAIEAEEAEVLQTIQMLSEKYEQVKNENELPTFENIRREMIDRKAKEYKKLLDKYGRKIKEIPEKFRKIAEAFSEAKDLAKWYDDNFFLREALYSLESFDMIQSAKDERTGREIFVLTETGKKILEDQKENKRDISSTAVKAITMTRKMFSAPATNWFEQAKEANLIGTAEPTKSGYLYAELSETIRRRPHVTKFELEVFHTIPARGITEEEVYAAMEKRNESRERVKWALEKLEARHLIEILPDGNIVETEAGEKFDKALAGAPEGLGNPITPVIYRVLEALKKVGTLYVKEKKVRVLPKNIKEALKLSGLSNEAFEDALKVARVAGFVGKNSVTTAGLLILEGAEKANPSAEEGLAGFVK